MHYQVRIEATKDAEEKPGEPLGFEASKNVPMPIRPVAGDTLCCCAYFHATVSTVAILLESQKAYVAPATN